MFSASIVSWELRHTLRQRWFLNMRRLLAATALFFFTWHLFGIFVLRNPRFGMMPCNHYLWLIRDDLYPLMATYVCAVIFLAPLMAVTGIRRAKNQRTLDLLLTSHQSAFAIVVGQFVAGLGKLFVLAAPVIPLMLWLVATLGWTWYDVALLLGIPYLIVAPMSAWSLLVAIRLRQSAAAILTAYAGSLLILLAGLTVYWEFMWRYFGDDENLAAGILMAVCATMAFLGLAARRLRLMAAGHEGNFRGVTGGWERSPLADEPIFWKQSRLSGRILPRFLRCLPGWVRIALFVGVTCALSLSPERMVDLTPYCEAVVIFIAYPLAALVWAGSTASVEREAGTWDPLRCTMLRADEFVAQTRRAIVPRLYVYWWAALPAVAILSCKRVHALGGLPVPLVWLTARVLISAATDVGIYYSVKSPTASAGVLSALGWFAFLLVNCGLTGLFFAFVSVEILVREFPALPPKLRFAIGNDSFSLFWPGQILLAVSLGSAAVFLSLAARYYYRRAAVAWLIENDSFHGAEVPLARAVAQLAIRGSR